MKVVLVNSFFPPWRGGAETYVYNLAKHLQRRGHEIVVICGSPPLNPGTQFMDGIRIERLRVAAWLYGTPIMPELLQRLLREKADILHGNFPSPYIAFVTSAATGLRGIPSLVTWHNDLPPVTPMARILVLTHNHLILPLYFRRFSFIIGTSRLYAETSPILRAHSERVVVVPNGVDTRRYNPDVRGEEIRSRLEVDNAKILLFVGALGRWHSYKGVDLLIKAMAVVRKRLPKTKLLIVGGGKLEKEYRRLAQQLHVDDSVIFAGEVSDDDLPKYYACSDLLALPSKDRSEGFGLTILEANATGKPAVGTTVGGIPSVIQNGYNGLLVPPNRPEALAEAIKTALADEDLLERMGRNGRKFAEQHDWSITAEQTENVYKRALAMNC